MDSLLKVDNLQVHFVLDDTKVRAVDGVDFEVRKGETFVLIGESGSGKSVLGMAILRLLPSNVEVKGRVLFDGTDLTGLPECEMRKVRGREIAWIPQNPATYLNPVLKVGFQIAEPMMVHLGINKEDALHRAIDLLKFFAIDPAEKKANEYPHQYSGGMKQRALVAMGTSTTPKLIIADEPTKGLDISRKTHVLELFKRIKKERELTQMVITHDLPFARVLADRIAIMYCGKLIEINEAEGFFEEPLHPYSKALLNSLPLNGMKPIRGNPPSMINPPEGCRFHPRCEYASDRCLKEPPLFEYDGNAVRCWQYD